MGIRTNTIKNKFTNKDFGAALVTNLNLAKNIALNLVSPVSLV